MPQDVSGVVVAVRAQRLIDRRIGVLVLASAAQGPPMLADAAVPSRAAPSPLRTAGTVHRAERGSGQSDEQPGVVLDIARDALAPQQAGANQVEGVARVRVSE